jgi:hypothetical protein
MDEQPPRQRSRQQVMDDAIAAGRRYARLNPPPDRPWGSLPLVARLEVIGVSLVVLVMLVAVCNRAT